MHETNYINSNYVYDINQIIECQQNRYPVLLIDRIISIQPGYEAVGLKCFTYNEWFFPAHFADDPNVPGFVQVESLVQTFIMTFLSLEKYKGMKTNFVSINNIKFKRKIIPGDQLIIKAKLNSIKRGLASGNAIGKIEGETACYAEFIVSIPEELEKYKPKLKK